MSGCSFLSRQDVQFSNARMFISFHVRWIPCCMKWYLAKLEHCLDIGHWHLCQNKSCILSWHNFWSSQNNFKHPVKKSNPTWNAFYRGGTPSKQSRGPQKELKHKLVCCFDLWPCPPPLILFRKKVLTKKDNLFSLIQSIFSNLLES